MRLAGSTLLTAIGRRPLLCLLVVTASGVSSTHLTGELPSLDSARRLLELDVNNPSNEELVFSFRSKAKSHEEINTPSPKCPPWDRACSTPQPAKPASELLVPFLMSLGAGLATTLGGAIVLCIDTHHGIDPKMMAFVIALAAGVMVSVSAL